MARERGMIVPFEPRQVREVDGQGVISFGVSSYGYDMRVDRQFKVLEPGSDLRQFEEGLTPSQVLDPKQFDSSHFRDFEGDVLVLPPHSYAIAHSLERFKIPRNILAIVQGKSTYARCGIQVDLAPLEPEWEGHLTFAIVNTTPLPAKIYAGEGIAQVLFLESDEVCAVSYADKQGKYQSQAGITIPKV